MPKDTLTVVDNRTGKSYELTIQDSPLNIAMESLLWQEDLNGPVALLGAEQGFSTNRGKKSTIALATGLPLSSVTLPRTNTPRGTATFSFCRAAPLGQGTSRDTPR